MKINEEDYLAHYGMPRRSGRYPWGSGGNASGLPRNASLSDLDAELKRQGFTETERAKALGFKSSTELRARKSIEKNALRQARINEAQKLKNKGMSTSAIARQMGEPEPTIRTLLAPGAKDKADVLTSTANKLRSEVNDKRWIQIGRGVENHLGVSDTRLKTAVAILGEEGYKVQYLKVPQVGVPGQYTTVKVLTQPDVSYSELYQNRGNIKLITSYSPDYGRSYLDIQEPISVNQKRVMVRYGDEGGGSHDGVIYVRPGVEDLSLGDSHYAQVRVKVNDTHYLKGMAIYKDDLPDGVDLVFNTNKKSTGNDLDAMKKLKDEDNPFGSTVRQIFKRDENGVEIKDADGNPIVSSAMNIVNEEGDWGEWSRSISSQVLSKQSPELAKKQLALAYDDHLRELEEISSLTNPVIKKHLLQNFADEADSAAVHLKAAALPRQGTHVILPMDSLPPNQVYAPNYKNGEPVVLIRHPHGGTFEIPELTVNNNHSESKRLLGNAKDAIAINSEVAKKLSGADFDGDSVLVIPNRGKKIKTDPSLKELKDFDPISAYPAYEGMKEISERTKQIQMGNVSNLITDMTIMGASHSEIARAVRHSMVVIDAKKHNLNYKQSELDNGIADLKRKYQNSARAGAKTLISRASSQERVPERRPRRASEGGPINRETGELEYVPTGRTYVNRAGKTVKVTEKSTKLREVRDANVLSSGTRMEKIYADHSNKLKSLANQARLELVDTPRSVWSESAKKVYAKEVESLNIKLDIAKRNAPFERQAQVLANVIVKAKRDAKPDMEDDELKKVRGRALVTARARTGAKKQRIELTPNEWDAIQAGAISSSKLAQIIANSDIDTLRELATPKAVKITMTSARVDRARSMLDAGFTRKEVADQLGVSLSTLDRSIKSGGS